MGGEGDVEGHARAPERGGADGEVGAQEVGPLLHPEQAVVPGGGVVERVGHGRPHAVVVDGQAERRAVEGEGDVDAPGRRVLDGVVEGLLGDPVEREPALVAEGRSVGRRPRRGVEPEADVEARPAPPALAVGRAVGQAGEGRAQAEGVERLRAELVAERPELADDRRHGAARALPARLGRERHLDGAQVLDRPVVELAGHVRPLGLAGRREPTSELGPEPPRPARPALPHDGPAHERDEPGAQDPERERPHRDRRREADDGPVVDGERERERRRPGKRVRRERPGPRRPPQHVDERRVRDDDARAPLGPLAQHDDAVADDLEVRQPPAGLDEPGRLAVLARRERGREEQDQEGGVAHGGGGSGGTPS